MTSRRCVNRRTFCSAITILSAGIAYGSTDSWLVYYASKEPVQSFRSFSTLILDSRYHPPLAPLAATGKKLFGYVSVGEASPDYSYYDALRSEGLLLRPNPNWPGNYSIDIRDVRWRNRLCDRIVPAVLEDGFHGIFLDTIDTVLYLEEQEPVRYAGMAEAAANLIRTIHSRFPSAPLILNRAYPLLDVVGSELYAALGESVFTTYDFAAKRYVSVDGAAYRNQVQRLQKAAAAHPGLRIYTLDYWDPADEEGIRKIYREERKNGFSPYVSSIDLTRIVGEPR